MPEIDLLGGMDWGQTMQQTVLIVQWAGILLFLVAILLVILYVAMFKYPVLIYDNGQWFKDVARKIKKGAISTYELKSSMFKPKMNKEVFMIPHNLIQRVGRKRLIMVEKLADGIYYPISKKKSELELKVTPQDLDWLLERTRKTYNKFNPKKWYESAWFAPTLFLAVAVIQFMIIVMVMDRVTGISAGVGGACKEAENRILDSVRQKITP